MERPAAHTWVEHTGELELELEASSPEELFAEALRALGGLLASHEADEAPQAAAGERLEIAASAPDRATLLAEWLSELAYHAESTGLVPIAATRIDLAPTTLEAEVEARPGRPPHLVKAVTYHRLCLAEADGRWHGRVVLDV